MSHAASIISTPGGITRFGVHHHGPSPLSTRTINSSTSPRFNLRHSNGLSEDSDEEDPPPYPGIEMTQTSGQSQDLQHGNQSATANSTCNNQVHHGTSHSSTVSESQDSLARDPPGSGPPGNPSTSPSLCLSELSTSDIDIEDQENDRHLITSLNNDISRETFLSDSNQQATATGSVNENDTSELPGCNDVTIATNDGNAEECESSGVENDVRSRLESQNSIVGTVV
jgi:hypothetical protein